MKSKVWKKKWKNITLIVASIKSAKFRCSTSVEHHFPTGPSLTQKCFKNIQLSEGASPPKNDYFAKKFLPRDWSPRKPPVYDFWAHFLKTEILLSMTLSENIKKMGCPCTAEFINQPGLKLPKPYHMVHIWYGPYLSKTYFRQISSLLRGVFIFHAEKCLKQFRSTCLIFFANVVYLRICTKSAHSKFEPFKTCQNCNLTRDH